MSCNLKIEDFLELTSLAVDNICTNSNCQYGHIGAHPRRDVVGVLGKCLDLNSKNYYPFINNSLTKLPLSRSFIIHSYSSKAHLPLTSLTNLPLL